jgi:hypothetical protein
MRLWEFIIQADNLLDIADPDSGWSWFRQQPWVPRTERDGKQVPYLPKWTPEECATWRRCLPALRSIVARTTTARPERAGPANDSEDRMADKLWNSYLARLTPRAIGHAYDSSRGGKVPFGPDVVVDLWPTDEEKGQVVPPGVDLHKLDVFWLNVFASLAKVEVTVLYRCGSCGKSLPPVTKTGKRNWRTTCADCTTSAWKSRNKDKVRSIWRRSKRKERRQTTAKE